MLNITARLGRKIEIKLLPPLLKFLYLRLKLTPHKISTLSFVLGFIAVLFILFNRTELALLFLMFALMFDVFDGAIARYFNIESKLGEKLELYFDRTNEAMLFLALAYIGSVSFKIAILAMIAILLMTLLRDKSRFDPGFKRTMLFVGYFINNFQLALNIIFLANMLGFVISLVIIDYKQQMAMDSKSLP